MGSWGMGYVRGADLLGRLEALQCLHGKEPIFRCWKVPGGVFTCVRARRFELKSLILAQIERWRHALHMQVERGVGATPYSAADG